MGTELVKVEPAESAEATLWQPVVSMDLVLKRRATVLEAVQRVMTPGVDYGAIPGTDKPTLLQPGAEKLCHVFGLVPRFETLNSQEDWTGDQHGSEPFFYYRVRCQLIRRDTVMGEGEGSCNSWESKYRWRKLERTCPECGKENIRKSKEGGWYCWKKTDGCGATFQTDDERVIGQEVGRKANPEIFDQVNTILKMAHKRAKVAATINATSAHEFFTQDLEERAGEPLTEETPKPTAQRPRSAQAAPQPAPVPLPQADGMTAMFRRMTSAKGCIDEFARLKTELHARLGAGGENEYYRILKMHGAEHASKFGNVEKARACAADMLRLLQSMATKAPESSEPGAVAVEVVDLDL